MPQQDVQPATRIAIIDTGAEALHVLAEQFPEFRCHAFAAPPATITEAVDVALWPSDSPESKARCKVIVDALFAASPKLRAVRVVRSPQQLVDGGEVVSAPRPKVVHISRAEQAKAEREARKAQALAPIELPSLQDLCMAAYEPKVPLFDGIFFPGAWLITGRPKVGKSWLLLQLALALAEGVSFLTRVCRATNAEVLLILAEDDNARVKSRLDALGVGVAPRNCRVITGEQFRAIAAVRSPYQPHFHEFLDQYLTEHPACRLVIIDTETSCRLIWQGEAQQQEGKLATKTDYREVGDMDKVALKHKAVIALVNHTSKAKTGHNAVQDPHEMINRTNTALAAASGQLVLTNCPGFEDSPELKMRQASWRGRDLIDDMNWALQQGTGQDLPLFCYRGDLGDVVQNQAELAILNAVEAIAEEERTERYISCAEIAEEIGKSRDTVKRSVSRMFRTGTQRFHKGKLVDHKRGSNGGIRLVGDGVDRHR